MNELLSRLRARIREEADDELLMELLLESEDLCKGYTNRDKLPDACKTAVVRTAVALYNRMGMEGESNHHEGGVVIIADAIPGDVAKMLAPYRLARTVGGC